MPEPTLHERLEAVFRQVFDDEDIVLRPDTTAKDVEGWDSLMHINLVVATERAFGVRFMLAELNTLRNVGQFEALIEKKLKAP